MAEPDLTQEPITDDFANYFNKLNEGTPSGQPEGSEAPAPADADAAQPESGGKTEGDDIQNDGDQDHGQPAPSAATAQGDDPGKGEPDPETIRKKAHGYDSMLGRLQAEQQARKQEQMELARMRDELAQMRGHTAQAPQPGPGHPAPHQTNQAHQSHPPQASQPRGPLPMAEIKEDIKEEAESFSKDYPDLVPLLRYPGREGEKLRKLLAEYGPDVAAIHGQGVMAQYRLHQSEQQMSQRLSHAEQAARQAREEALQQIETDRKQKHYAEIASRHEEVQWMADPRRQQDYARFRHELDEWVMDRPMREAQYIKQVLAQGVAPDVIQVLDMFKQSRTVPQQNQAARAEQRNTERDTLASAAAAVPGRRTAGPRGGGPSRSNDFESAWEEFARH